MRNQILPSKRSDCVQLLHTPLTSHYRPLRNFALHVLQVSELTLNQVMGDKGLFV